MIKGMSHVGISVSSLDRAIEFYHGLLGMEVKVRDTFGEEGHLEEYEKYKAVLGLRDPRGKVALLSGKDMQIELFEFHSPEPKSGNPNRPVCDRGITHFCLQVADIYGEYTRLKAAGVSFHCVPQKFFGKAIVTYGRDPDGNVFELLELLDNDNSADSLSTSAHASA